MYGTPQHQGKSRTFNDWLAAYRLRRIVWTDPYLSQDILVGHIGGPLIVDVGGSLGEDLELCRQNNLDADRSRWSRTFPTRSHTPRARLRFSALHTTFSRRNQIPAGVCASTAPGPYHGKRPTKMLLTNRSSTKTKLQAQQIIETIGNNKLEACDDTAERRRISAPSIFNQIHSVSPIPKRATTNGFLRDTPLTTRQQ
jgi:hypothetical protein